MYFAVDWVDRIDFAAIQQFRPGKFAEKNEGA